MADQDALSRPGPGRARRLVRALGVGGLILAAWAAAPAVADAAGVLVRLGATQRHFTPDEVRAAVDQPAGSYGLRAQGTAAEPAAHPPALSMRRLVALAGGAPDAMAFVSIERPNGTLAILGRGDLADPAPFPEGPPIVWMDGDGARYLRPLRGPADANGADNIAVTGGDLRVRAHQGALLTVRARADRRTVPAGEPVSLTASVTAPAAPPGLSVRWSFGDGTGKPGPAVRHRFDQPGVYEVVAEATGSDDSGGSSPPLRIRVGRQRPGDGERGGGTGRDRAPAQGPANGGRDDGGGVEQRRGGQGGGEGGGTERSGGTERGGGAGAAERGGGAPAATMPTATGPAATTPGATAPAATSPRTPAPAATTPAAPQATTPARSAPKPKPPAERRPRRATRDAATADGPVVRGLLVAASTAAALPSASAPARTTAAQAAARRGRERRDGEPLGLPAAGLAVSALLGLGVRRELRRLPPSTRTAP